MSHKTKPGQWSHPDVPVLDTLFDVGERDHIVSLVRGAHDPTPTENRASLASGIETRLIPSAERYIEHIYEHRGAAAYELESAESLLRNAQTLARLLRLSHMSVAQSADCADTLNSAWTRFMADAASPRIGELTRELARQADYNIKLNEGRQLKEDDALIADFRRWQESAKTQLAHLPPEERVKRYKIAKRPLPDRKGRRINRLLRENKIPPVPRK